MQECIQEAQNIREAIDKLACVQDKALLMSMGFSVLNASESEPETDSETDIHLASSPTTSAVTVTPFDTLHEILKKSNYNYLIFLNR